MLGKLLLGLLTVETFIEDQGMMLGQLAAKPQEQILIARFVVSKSRENVKSAPRAWHAICTNRGVMRFSDREIECFVLQGDVVRERSFRMLVLSRKIGETIVVPDCTLTITVVQVRGNRVKLGFCAPENVTIVREEISQRRSSNETGTTPYDTRRTTRVPCQPR